MHPVEWNIGESVGELVSFALAKNVKPRLVRKDKKLLAQSLTASGKAIGALLAQSLEAGGKVRGFKPHATAFLGYLISHESHHRGQIALSLKQAGKPLDKKIGYGLWEWGVR